MTEINVTNETIEEIQKKKSSRRKLWIINTIYFFCLPIMAWFIWATSYLTFIFPMKVFFANILIVILYNLSRKWQIFRITLNIVRVITILLVVLSFVPTIILSNFKKSEFMYPAKKYVFAYGVRSSTFSSTTMSRFPEALPENAEDYFFKTQPKIPAPEYRPLAILSFRTDKTTMEQFEAECKENGGQLVEYNTTFEEYLIENNQIQYKDDAEYMESLKNEFSKNRGFPINLIKYLDEVKQDDILGNSVVYKVESTLPHGYAFDYDSGLVVIWG